MICRTGLTVVVLTSNAIAEDPKIWRRVDKGIYDIVFASPEVILGPRSWFWQHTVRKGKNEFRQRLHCIAIDEAHVIWGWQDFKEEYRSLGDLKDVFPSVPTLILSATVTLNILEYIRVLLKLSPPSRIYWQPLDWPNLTYIVSPIRKDKFEDLAFLVPSAGTIGEIPKTMIFVDKIDDAIEKAKYLQSGLPERIRSTPRADNIIRIFSANLRATTRTGFLGDLRLGETRIWICTECAGIDINLSDIQRAVQFKISEYISLPELLRRLGCRGRDVSRPAIAIVFVETRQILLDDLNTLDGSAFKDLRLPVSQENRDQITDVIIRLYRENIQSKARKTGNAYQKTDSAILWFLNTIGCRRRMVLACFMCKMAFDDQLNRDNCCDNCMFKSVEVGQVPEFNICDMTARMGIMYKSTVEYADLLLSTKRNRLFAATLVRNPRTAAKLTIKCKTALNDFAQRIWPN